MLPTYSEWSTTALTAPKGRHPAVPPVCKLHSMKQSHAPLFVLEEQSHRELLAHVQPCFRSSEWDPRCPVPAAVQEPSEQHRSPSGGNASSSQPQRTALTFVRTHFFPETPRSAWIHLFPFPYFLPSGNETMTSKALIQSSSDTSAPPQPVPGNRQ